MVTVGGLEGGEDVGGKWAAKGRNEESGMVAVRYFISCC